MLAGSFPLIAFGAATGSLVTALLLSALEFEFNEAWAALIGSALGVFGAFLVAWYQFTAAERERRSRENRDLHAAAMAYFFEMQLIEHQLIFLVRYGIGSHQELGRPLLLTAAFKVLYDRSKIISSLPPPPLQLGHEIAAAWISSVYMLAAQVRSCGNPNKVFDEARNEAHRQILVIWLTLRCLQQAMHTLNKIILNLDPTTKLDIADPLKGLKLTKEVMEKLSYGPSHQMPDYR